MKRHSYRPFRLRFSSGPGLTLRQKRGIALILGSTIALFLLLSFSRNLVPVMAKMAVNESYELVTAAVNEAIQERLLDGTISYSELIILERDNEGNITALTTDVARINALSATITNEVVARIGALADTRMQVPLGNIIGGAFLSGRGPGIGFRVVTLGNPTATFSNAFSTAGINQTRHQILLEFTIYINILVPGQTTNETITTQMLVAETVIVGDVPDTFGQFHFGGTQ